MHLAHGRCGGKPLSVSRHEELEEDVVALMRKRVYDLSGVLGKSVKVPLP